MLKHKLKAKNPLSIIAILSVLTQASASTALPHINSENQEIYVWFLVLFPLVLVVLFFVTLNFNNKTLYSPSDFTSDASFIHVNVTDANTSQAKDKEHASARKERVKPMDWSEAKLRLCPPQSLISLTQTQSTDALQAQTQRGENAATELIKKYKSPTVLLHHFLTSFTAEHLHIANLVHASLHIEGKKHLKDELLKIFKTIASAKHGSQKKGLLILLINNSIDALIKEHALLKQSSKKNHFMEDTLIMTYNTQTAAMKTNG